MDEIIRFRDRYYILATSALADDRVRVLKEGETFAVFDRYGDLQPVGIGEQGIYHEGTRFLHRLELRLEGRRPLLLSSTVKESNELLAVDLANPDLDADEARHLAREQVHIFRSALLCDGVCYLRFRFRNHAVEPVRFLFSLHFEGDFADIFEVRGVRRPRRGERMAPSVREDSVLLDYRGLDGRLRRTRLRFEPRPLDLQPDRVVFRVALEPRETATYYAWIACELDAKPARLLRYEEAAREARLRLQRRGPWSCRVRTANEYVNEWLERSAADLAMLVTDSPQGPFPYAGIPWFSAPFGRDALVTALEVLWIEPAIARGVLSFLASTQAREEEPERDAQPGKILHEARGGEMAVLGEIPFERYYGSVDATPLFLLLAGEYYRRTADRELVDAIWPALERALAWLDRFGDLDGDGLVEYSRRSGAGLENQGWKDSHDSVFHADGSLARGPIALCEVQAYAWAARQAAADLAAALGREATAARQRELAERLRERFESRFWSEELGTYVLALDGDKRPCRVRASNAGHALFAGIAAPERAVAVARSLMSEAFYSGWGIRTVAEGEARFNPMSYHNGSVWPHDNALIAAGFARYQLKDPALRVFRGLFDASQFVELHRLPELFCGFPRRPGEGPTLYPVACAPQAWAAGAPFLLLQAILGLGIDAAQGRVLLARPRLPAFLEELELRGLRVGDASLDLALTRHAQDVSVNVLRRSGRAEVVVVK